MPIDPNEAPEGMIAVEHSGDECPGEVCLLFGKSQCNFVKCHAAQRKDKTCCYFIKKPQPTETKPMESEHEYLDADSLENCKTILEWIFNGGCEVKRTVVSKEIIMQVEWESASGVLNGRTYRRKKPQTDVLIFDLEDAIRGVEANVVQYSHRYNGNVGGWVEIIKGSDVALLLSSGVIRLKPGCKLPPKKVKKLVPRTPEEFWPLIGKWWGKHKENKTNRFLILNANAISDQENWEIAPLGSEEWQPMMVLKEVEGEECAG